MQDCWTWQRYLRSSAPTAPCWVAGSTSAWGVFWSSCYSWGEKGRGVICLRVSRSCVALMMMVMMCSLGLSRVGVVVCFWASGAGGSPMSFWMRGWGGSLQGRWWSHGWRGDGEGGTRRRLAVVTSGALQLLRYHLTVEPVKKDPPNPLPWSVEIKTCFSSGTGLTIWRGSTSSSCLCSNSCRCVLMVELTVHKWAFRKEKAALCHSGSWSRGPDLEGAGASGGSKLLQCQFHLKPPERSWHQRAGPEEVRRQHGEPNDPWSLVLSV